MATENHSESTESSQPKSLEEIDAHLLEQAAERLVRYGQQVGVSAEEMVSLFDSGISIHDLLAFLAAKCSGAA